MREFKNFQSTTKSSPNIRLAWNELDIVLCWAWFHQKENKLISGCTHFLVGSKIAFMILLTLSKVAFFPVKQFPISRLHWLLLELVCLWKHFQCVFAGRGKWAFLLFPESFEHLLLSPTQAKSSAKIKRHHELKITVFPISKLFSFTLALNVNLGPILFLFLFREKAF